MNASAERLANVNGKIVPLDQATVHVLSPAVKYASAVFEGIRGYWSAKENDLYVFRLDEHIERLFASMKVMRFALEVSPDTIRNWILETIRANGHRETVHIRILAYVDGRGEQGAAGPISFAVTTAVAPRSQKFETGIRLGVSSWVRISDRVMPPRVKCVANYNNGRLATMEVKMHGYDNALFLTESGKVAETPGSCFFMIKGNRLITPSPDQDILESITRDTVIAVARENGLLEVVERPVDRSECYLADEAFVCGSNQEILPVVGIDGLKIGEGKPGKHTKNLQDSYIEVVEGRRRSRSAWCISVYAHERRTSESKVHA